MKKKLAVLLAAVLTLSMGVTAFAAESPKTESKAVTSSTKGVSVYETSKETAKAASDEAEKVNSKADVLAVVDVTYEGEIPAGGIQITLNAADVKKGDNIVLLHWNGTKWEQIKPDYVGDGYVIATFTDLSPVAIVKLPKATDNKSATKTGISPKTGDR